ncbi:MFS transporter [Aeromicrobium sp. CTD01-1L150]|uniref:MFS transporter n=1 Tax=Aeromicrobium sp. CTD01-1L150 TaxID=3341830 RepID=UPI0035BF7FF2
MSRPRRSILAQRTYRNLFLAQVTALLGTGLLTVALSLLAFDIAPGSAGSVVATALTIKMMAYVGVAPVVTAAVSRFEPRTVLLTANVVRALVAGSLPWVEQVWQIYLLIFVLQSASATFTPAFQAVVPTVLPDEDEYTRALSLSRLAYDLEAVVSPLIAAALLLVLPYHGLFVGTAIGFAVSSALVLRAGLAVQASDAQAESFWSRATRGVRLFARRPALRALVALDLAVAAATAHVLVNTVVVVRQDFGRGETGVAIALGAFGAGSMLVALTVPSILRRVEDRTVMMVGAGTASVALLLASSAAQDPEAWPLLLLVWALLGSSTSMVMTPAGRVVNRSVRAVDRPAAFAAHFSLSHACFLLAYPVAGWAGSSLDVAASALVLAAVAGLAALAGWLLWSPATADRSRRTMSQTSR